MPKREHAMKIPPMQKPRPLRYVHLDVNSSSLKGS